MSFSLRLHKLALCEISGCDLKKHGMFLNVQRIIIIELTNPLVRFPHFECRKT